MEDLETEEKLLKLGKRLVENFEGAGNDEICEWMAHYLQEQIYEFESSKGVEQKLAKKECFETILMLWEYRSNFPYKLKPFNDIDKILDVIRYLDPKNSDSFYYWVRNDKNNIPENIVNNIESIVNIDYFARLMITFFIKETTLELAGDSMHDWIEVSEEIAQTPESRILIELAPDLNGSVGEERSDHDEIVKELEEHISKVEEFEIQVLAMKEELAGKLKSLKE